MHARRRGFSREGAGLAIGVARAAALSALFVLAGHGRLHAQTQSISICVTEFPPYLGSQLPDGGPLLALASRALASGGLQARPSAVPWARALTLARAGECLLPIIWRNAERDQGFAYSQPVADMQLGLFVRQDHVGGVKPGDAIAVERSGYLPPSLTEGGFALNPTGGTRQTLRMLAAGRVVAAFTERAAAEEMLRAEPALGAQLRWQGPAIEVKTTYMAVSRDHPLRDTLLNLLNAEIARRRER
jgi:polar amino acid transport system substrate-binding protein